MTKFSKKIILLSTVLFFLSLFIYTNVFAAVKAFPTAEGFGADTVGGRGGRVIEVTNLDDSGAGSLRACVDATGPRTCVFRVSGTIVLQSTIFVSTPYLTIAGQTSPGGIQIKGTTNVSTGITIRSGAHNVIARYLRVRTGGPAPRDVGESFIVYGDIPGVYVHDVIFDHISLEWGTDAQYMSYKDATDTTIQWSIIAEGADDGNGSGHKGSHYGGYWDVMPARYTDHHNLYASNGQRSPLIQHAGIFDLRNDVVYNWGGNNAAELGSWDLDQSVFGNVVNNLYISGPNSRTPAFWINNGGPTRTDGGSAEGGGSKIYTSGNWGPACPSGCGGDDWPNFYTLDYYSINGALPAANSATFRALTPYATASVTTDPTSQLKSILLPKVGANVPSRDVVDARIINDVNSGTGNITAIGYGGPWPTLTGPSAPADSDHDGMPDSWETSHGLNPNNVSDGPATSSNGYTNVENYLNELAGDSIPGSTTPSPDTTPPSAPANVRVQ